MRIGRVFARIWMIVLAVSLALVVGVMLARVLLPLLSSKAPQVVAVTPASGTHDVSARSSIAIRFSEPVNRRSVERAMQLEPPTPGNFSWRDDGRTLLFTPAVPLTANVTYTVSLGAGAQGRFFGALAAPMQSSFATAPAPIVVAALPTGSAVTPETPVALVFSRPMVAEGALRQPVNLPQLRFEPPLAGSVRWLDSSTLLFRPNAPLPLATRFHATLDGALTDLSGSPLGANYDWSFETPAPAVLRQTPPAGAEDVAPAQPLVVELSQPLAADAIARGFTITPTVAGSVTSAISGTGQLLTFTPTGGWEAATTYAVELPSLSPAVGTLPLPPTRWSFRTAPRPALVGRFPGQGQLLPRGQAIRLIFSSPVNTATLESNLALEPPAGALQTSVSGPEVRLNADLRAGTAYTLTLSPGITDRNGVALDQSYQLHFVTAPAPPELVLPEVAGHFVNLLAAAPPTLAVQRTNLTALTLDVYSLDEATLLRTFGFDTNSWRSFSPERYNQALLRTWSVPLTSDAPGQPVTSVLPLNAQADGSNTPLASGAYYLRLRSAEGPGADVVLMVSNASLMLKSNDNQVLVWATDARNQSPLAAVPLTLYEGNSIVARGQSDANGLWLVTHTQAIANAYLVLAGTFGDPTAFGTGAAVSSAWTLNNGGTDTNTSDYQLALFTDQSAYAPKATVRIGGLVRQASDTIASPPRDTLLELSLLHNDSTDVITTSVVRLDRSGVVSATLDVNGAAPGLYTLRAVAGTNLRSLPIRILPATPPPFEATLAQQDTGSLVLRAATRQGRPIAGATVAWTMTGTRDSGLSALPTDYTFGDDEQPQSAPFVLQGTGTTNDDGNFILPLPSSTTLTETTRLLVNARVAEPGGLSSETAISLTLPATTMQLGLRASRLGSASEQPRVDVLTLDHAGASMPNTPVVITVLRRSWERDTGQPADAPLVQHDVQVQTRQVTTDVNGRATLNLDLRRGGVYRLVAIARDNGRRTVRSAVSTWLTPSGGFESDWVARDDQVLVIADQAGYRPGDTARLLVGLPQPETTAALVILERSGQITATVRTLRANQLLDIPISPVLAGVSGTSTSTAPLDLAVVVPRSGQPAAVGHVRLPVITATESLSVTVRQSLIDSPSLPTPAAAITLTVRDGTGRPASADLLLGVLDDDTPQSEPLGSTDLEAIFRPLPAPPVVIAQTQAILPTQARPLARTNGASGSQPTVVSDMPATFEAHPPAYWRSGLRTNGNGVLTLQVPLPDSATRWRIGVLAGAGALFGQVSVPISATQWLLLDPHVPPLLRVGDLGTLSLSLRNPSSQTVNVSATLQTSGLTLAKGAAATQPFQLLPGAESRLDWPVLAGIGLSAQAHFMVQVENGSTQTAQATLKIRPSGSPQIETGTFSGAVRFTSAITPTDAPRWGQLELAWAPDRVAAVGRSEAFLAAQPLDGVEHLASLLLIDGLLIEQNAARTPNAQGTSVLRVHAQQSIQRLLDEQRDSGSWGWWSDGPPDLGATGYALEALAQANAAGLTVPAAERERALTYLTQQLDTNPPADADLRAYGFYVLTLYNRGQPEAARALLRASTSEPPTQQLHADGLAYLALALPDDAGAALEQLTDLAQLAPAAQSGSQAAPWSVDEPGALPRNSLSVTALVARAFQRTQPSNTLLAPALRTLTDAWGVDGWPTPLGSARAAATLLGASQIAQATAQRSPYTVTLNGTTVQLPTPTTAPTAAVKLTLPITSAAPRLAINGGNDDDTNALLAYRFTRDAPAVTRSSPEMALDQDYLDAVTGQPLDPTQLQAGQLVRVRLTLVATERQSFVSLHEAICGAFELLDAHPEAPFAHVTSTPADLTFAAQTFEPGIYIQTYLVRAIAPGNYSAPPPIATRTYASEVAVQGGGSQVVVK